MPPHVFTSLAQFAVVNAVLVLAQVVYVAFGFGSGLIAVGLLALMFPGLQDVVVLLLLVNLPAEILVVVRSWREIIWRRAGAIAAGVVVGVPLGTYVLKTGSPDAVLTGLGVFLVAVSGVLLRLRDDLRVAWPRWSGPPVGLAGGVLTGLFGTGGPPLIIYAHLAGLTKGAFRGNLMAIFLLQTCLRIPAYAVSGLLTAPRLWSGVLLMPAALLGTWAGQRLHVQLSEPAFRRLVSVLLGVIGLLLLLKQIR
jgi:uncharacterized membrane protein YfcA